MHIIPFDEKQYIDKKKAKGETFYCMINCTSGLIDLPLWVRVINQ